MLPRVDRILGKKTLITGEAGSGKTELASRLLKGFLELLDPKEITIIDIAPERRQEIGGRIVDYMHVDEEVVYLFPEKVYTPRLSGSTPQLLLYYAEQNKRMVEPLLERFAENPSKLLILNDLTIYLHTGKLEKVLRCARSADTFLGTAYCGSRLSGDLGTGISRRERKLVRKLATFMDTVIRM